MVYYHPVQLFNTRVWYGLLPFHPTFSTPGSTGIVYYQSTIPSNFSTPGSGMVYYHSIQLFNTKVNGWNFWKLTSSRYVAKKRENTSVSLPSPGLPRLTSSVLSLWGMTWPSMWSFCLRNLVWRAFSSLG